MICPYCKRRTPHHVGYCVRCGTPFGGMPWGYAPMGYCYSPLLTNDLAIVALFASFINCIVGLILGIIAHRRAEERFGVGHGASVAAIIISVIGIVLTLAVVAVVVLFLNMPQ